ncbi:deoxyribodipyrimidine photo-lyase [Oceanicoccus sp. KOV_DT_Chl]|uniref:deoxyribodipyrimidine photo-lyase n=1 Tax=Oceanicoccus sp. KOV_DT_Chl TaxID=1904639 RepID=UPI000C7E1A67|nr:deoxyribodipyrimidine photo-lyase [Oceanicoccus sp. KOV_DT_Chl]
MTNKLVWFRQDLRVDDNTALSKACENPDDHIYALFIATPGQWQLHDMAPRREHFIRAHVNALRSKLEKINIQLLYFETPFFTEIPTLIAKLITEHKFSAIYANHEYGWNEKKRDQHLEKILAAGDCHFHRYHDQSMQAPGLLTQTGKPYTVFTPFKKRWLENWRISRPTLLAAPAKRKVAPTITSSLLPATNTTEKSPQWPIGETAAQRRLTEFCQQQIDLYKKQRDFPDIDGTSGLSPWLAAGVLSPRQCLATALDANQGMLTSGQEGIDCWISELIWRDFYIHILDCFPQVSRNKAFKPATENIQWRNNSSDFEAWCNGNTGFPIIDAAMRQLTSTGWMHNRLRMITAMFLSKQLLIDWRWGERFFMQHLIDGHLAANNGGWQWAASTGTDAVPYFRIFNPVTQSQRFDAEGHFIRRYVPELANIQGKDIHLPPPLIRASQAAQYPAPIIDLKLAREDALSAYGKLRDS